jgi:inorganic triphosphatase YgiF
MPVKLDGSDIEVAVDVGEIKTGSGSVPICEAELELKSGHVASVYKLAQELNKRVPLAIEPMSKAERGYALAANAKPVPRRAESIRLDRSMTAGHAFQLIVRNCLLHLRANEASVRAATAADGVHQLRVAIRRLRSAFAAFGSMLPPDERRRVGGSVRWIAQRCGRARELDVFQSDVVRPLWIRLSDDEALRDFGTLVESARKEAYAQVRAAIDSREYTETLLALEAWIESDAWRTTDVGHDVPIQDFARAVMKRLHRKLIKEGANLERLDETGLHALRLRAKKLRYAAEFFRSLFRGRAIKSYIDALVAIQDRLGSLNDGVVARGLVASIEQEHAGVDKAAYGHAVGIVLGWNACRVTGDLKRLPALWNEFRSLKPPWK